MKKIYLITFSFLFIFAPHHLYAAETTVSYGPYAYGTNVETINIPANSQVYIGELQTDSSYSNYLSQGGFFVGGYAASLEINGVYAMHEQNSSDETAGYNYETYYWKSVYEEEARYREGSTDSTFGTSYTVYREETEISNDRRLVDITNLINLGQDNIFSFYHNTDSDQGYVLKIISDDEEITFNTDFTPPAEGFSFDNFASSADAELIRDFFHLYDYNLLYYSDWENNFYWKWDVDRIIASFKPTEEDGKCFGFNFSAWDFYNGFDNVTNYQTTAGSVYDLEQANEGISKKIKGSFYYQMSQEFNDYYNVRQETGDYTISNVYNVIKDYFASTAKADFIIGVFSAAGGGHALTPYRLVDSTDGNTAYLYVYDSNYHGQEKTIIFNDLNSDSPRWRYLPDYDSDNGDSIYYYFLPNIYDGTVPSLPGQKKDKMVLHSLGAEGNVLITDEEGQNLGYGANGSFYNDIPDAYPQWKAQSNGKISAFFLPANKTYTITVYDAADFEIYLTDKNKSLELSGTKTSDSDYITVAGNELSFTTYEGAEIDLVATKKTGTNVYQYILSGLTPAANESITAEIKQNSDLEISNTFASTKTADITVKKETLDQQVILKAANISLNIYGVQTLDVTNWDDLANSQIKLDGEVLEATLDQQVQLPRIIKIRPSSVKKSKLIKINKQNYKIAITGDNFQQKSKVKLGNKKVKRVIYKSKKKLIIIVNLSKYKKGYHRLTVINPNKQKVYMLLALRIR